MKRLINIVTAICILTTGIIYNPTFASVQHKRQKQLKKLPSRTHKKPQLAVIGSTPERRAAWEKLSTEQQKNALEKFHRQVSPFVQKAAKERRNKPFPQLTDIFSSKDNFSFYKEKNIDTQQVYFTDTYGNQKIINAAEYAAIDISPPQDSLLLQPQRRQATRSYEPSIFRRASFRRAAAISATQIIEDSDADSLPDSFETQVADAFTPTYFISANERPGTGFATFGNYVPQTVAQVFGAVPPISHYRVTPLGFIYSSDGIQLGILQIDYLTLWNRDDGLDIGYSCKTALSAAAGLAGYSTSLILDGIGAHEFDNERSAVLVGAVTTNSDTYNTDPYAYYAARYYTAAHENVPLLDQSRYVQPLERVPAGNHINLAISQSKHGTYNFNPNNFPIVQDWVIASTYSTIEFLYFYGYISEYEYLTYLFLADSAYYRCVIEEFNYQGGSEAGTRINVGELYQPINGSVFIQDPKIADKFRKVLW